MAAATATQVTTTVVDPGSPSDPGSPGSQGSMQFLLNMDAPKRAESRGGVVGALRQLVYPDRPPVPAIPARSNVMCFKNPREIVHAVLAISIAKAKLPFADLCILAFLSGAYVGLGATFAFTVMGGLPGFEPNYVSIQKLLYGATFPVGLMVVIICGSELFTGNTAVFVPGYVSGKVTAWETARNIITVYFMNFLGGVFVAYFLAYLTDLWGVDPHLSRIRKLAKGKMELNWGVAFLRAIGCNWLVCLAVWICIAAEDIIGKIWGAWFPIMAFAAIGYEHSVANMFIVPVGLMYGAEGNFGKFIYRNLIPVTLGNIVGGTVLCGMIYTFLYLRPTPGAGAAPAGGDKK